MFSNEQLRHLDLTDESFVQKIWNNFSHLRQEFKTLSCFKAYVKGLQSGRMSILGGVVIQDTERARGFLGGTQLGSETRLVTPKF